MRVLSVSYNFLPYGCDQDFLLPPDARDWLPPGHLSWTVIDAVEDLEPGAFLAYYRSDGKGRPAGHPKMMTSLVLYCYCKGIRSSRAVQMACPDDAGCRVITGNQAVGHATVARFARRHRDALTSLFVQVLAVCAREGLVTVGLVAGDGTKVKASASKASSRTLEELGVSTGELQKALEAEASAWWRQADLLDDQEEREPSGDGPAGGAGPAAGTRKRTADRLARARQAREMLTERHRADRRCVPPVAGRAGLIISHGTFLRNDFTRHVETAVCISDGTPMAWIDWDTVIAALDGGRLPASGGEKRIVHLAASLVAGHPVTDGRRVRRQG